MFELPPKDALHADYYDLLDFYGPEFNIFWCTSDDEKGHEEAAKYADADEFNRKTHVYTYQNIALMVQGMRRKYIAAILEMCDNRRNVSLIDVSSGGGQLGLAFHSLGFIVSFADIVSVSLSFLEWRLRKRGLGQLKVYAWNVVQTLIPRQDIAICFDTLEHLEEKEQRSLLVDLGKVGKVVFVNLLRATGELDGLHVDVNFDKTCEFVKSLYGKKVTWEDFYPDKAGKPQQRLLVYGEVLEAKK